MESVRKKKRKATVGFTARRYASAVLAVALCLSVYVSDLYFKKLELVVGMEVLWYFSNGFYRLTVSLLVVHHPSLFHTRHRTFLFCKSFPP